MENLFVISVGLIVAFVIVWDVDLMLKVAFALALIIEPTTSTLLPEVKQLHWMVTIFYVWVWLVVLVRIALGKVEPTNGPLPVTFLYFFLFLFCGALGSAYAMNFSEAISAGKGYLQVWVIPFVFYFLLRNDKSAAWFALALLVLAAVQPIFASVQYYLWQDKAFVGDRIGGLFGGELGGGATLSMFQLSQFLVVLSLAKFRIISWRMGLLLSIWVFLPLFFTHAKAIVLLLPIGVAVLFWREVKARPLHGVLLIGIGIAFSAILAFQYFLSAGSYKADPLAAPQTFDEFIEQSLGYAVMDSGKEKLNRGTSIVHWFGAHSILENPIETFVGHGLGSAKDTGQVIGHLYDHPEYGRPGMGITTVSRLLWEVGLLGTIAFIGAFAATARFAGRLSDLATIPALHRSILSAYSALAVVFIVSMFWRKDFSISVTFGTFAMFPVGYVVYWFRATRGRLDDLQPKAME